MQGSAGGISQWWEGGLEAWPPSSLAVSTLRSWAVPANGTDGRGFRQTTHGPQVTFLAQLQTSRHWASSAEQPPHGPQSPECHSRWSTDHRAGREGEDTRCTLASPDSPQGPHLTDRSHLLFSTLFCLMPLKTQLGLGGNNSTPGGQTVANLGRWR